MTTHYQDELDNDALSVEQLLYIALHSDHKLVQEAFKKLEFIIRLAHTEDEITGFSKKLPLYEMRVSIPAKDTYETVKIQVQGNMAELHYEDYGVVGRLHTNKETIFYLGSLK